VSEDDPELPKMGLADTSVFIVQESGRRVNVNDMWIAATAMANQLPIVTQDDDFDALADLGGPVVIRV